MAFQEGFNPFGGINRANSGSGDDSGGGGGSGALVLHVTVTIEGGDAIYSLDKTAGEIAEAIEAGAPVMIYHSEGDKTYIFTLADYGYGLADNNYYYAFEFFSPSLEAESVLFEYVATAASLEAAAVAYPSLRAYPSLE